MKKVIRWLTALAAIPCALLLALAIFYQIQLPDRFSVTQGQTLQFEDQSIEVSARMKKGVVETSLSAGNSYQAELKLFGILPVKQVTISVVEETEVIPCGTPFGIKMFTDGVVVVGMSSVDAEKGAINPAANAGIKIGDVIVSINGATVNTNEEVAAEVERSNGEAMDFVVRRDNLTFHVDVTAVKSISEERYKLGAWVRDSSAGIGTMTFYEPESGIFGGLGHAVCDIDTGDVLPLQSGEVVPVDLSGVVRGEVGQPGELRGSFAKGDTLGTLTQNGETGVYGQLRNFTTSQEAMQVAMKQEVHTGDAQIITTIDDGGYQYYDVQIEKVHFNDGSPTRNLIVKITDETLLEKTGGIVQGMSGSPIIQDGKLVGAVTHVFVNDPTRGYGIFAENIMGTLIARQDQCISIGAKQEFLTGILVWRQPF